MSGIASAGPQHAHAEAGPRPHDEIADHRQHGHRVVQGLVGHALPAGRAPKRGEDERVDQPRDGDHVEARQPEHGEPGVGTDGVAPQQVRSHPHEDVAPHREVAQHVLQPDGCREVGASGSGAGSIMIHNCSPTPNVAATKVAKCHQEARPTSTARLLAVGAPTGSTPPIVGPRHRSVRWFGARTA